MSLILTEKKAVTKHRSDESCLLRYANQNRSHGFFNDVIIQTETKSFPANRLVLSCYSEFFEKTFKTEMQEKYEKVVKTPTIDGKTMEILINFIYTGEITIDSDNVFNILPAADYLLIDEVKSYCFEFLADVVTKHNCFDFLNITNFFESSLLQNAIKKIVNANFNYFQNSEKLKFLSERSLLFCLSSLNSKSTSEKSKFEAIVFWTNHDAEARKEAFPKLFQLLNLDLFSLEYLTSVVFQAKLVEENPFCSKLVKNTLTNKVVQKSKRSNIICIGADKFPSKIVEVHSVFLKKCNTLPNVPVIVTQSCSLQLDDALYIMGGLQKTEKDMVITSRVWKLDLNMTQLKWLEMESLNCKRHGFGATVCRGTIAVSGGYSGTSVLSSTEIHNKLFDEWTTLKPMQKERYGHELIACENCLIAMGGKATGKVLSSVEQLTSFKASWSKCTPMQTPRVYFAAVNCKETIFAIGGLSCDDGKSRLKSVEKFDFANQKWCFVANMNYSRSGHSACVLVDKIYVAGGFDEDGRVIRDIESYDLHSNEWCIIGQTEFDLTNHSLLLV